jgi:hypothetical protein
VRRHQGPMVNLQARVQRGGNMAVLCLAQLPVSAPFLVARLAAKALDILPQPASFHNLEISEWLTSNNLPMSAKPLLLPLRIACAYFFRRRPV